MSLQTKKKEMKKTPLQKALNNEFSKVSGRPPFLDVIVAQPKAADSMAVLPNGSCHLEGTTEIEAIL